MFRLHSAYYPYYLGGIHRINPLISQHNSGRESFVYGMKLAYSFFTMMKHLFIGYPVHKSVGDKHENKAIYAVAVVSSIVVSGFIIVNYLKGHYPLVAAESLSLLLFMLCVMPFFRDNNQLRQNLVVSASSILLLALLVDGGVAKVAIFWSLLIPFVACLFLGLPKAWYWIVSYALVIAVIFALHLFWQPFLPYDNSLLVYFPFVFLQFSMLAAILQSQYEWSELKYQKSITELGELKTNLEGKVQQRTKDLIKTNHELKEKMRQHDETVKALHDSEIQVYQMQKMETIGTLVGGIAHDFNNMLAGINANMFMIKRKVTDEPDLLKRTKDVESLVMSASDMIRQLLTFAKKDHVAFEHFDLVLFIHESFDLVKVAISEHVQVKLENKENTLPVHANQTQIQQVIMNMVNNARDASLQSTQPYIQVSVKKFVPNEAFKAENPNLQSEAYALITIADNGSGIPTEQLNKIFEPFFTTKEAGKGTGLGLAMCLGAIESHGGTIKVVSKLGKGTAFRVYIPLCFDKVEYVDASITLDQPFNSDETILLVDDDERLRTSQASVLESLGYDVLTAEHGKEAVQIFSEHFKEVDLVVMDLTMPIMGGAQAAKRMRKVDSNVKIIFITGYDRDSTINEINTVDVGEVVLEKPYTMMQLQNAIRNRLMAKT